MRPRSALRRAVLPARSTTPKSRHATPSARARRGACGRDLTPYGVSAPRRSPGRRSARGARLQGVQRALWASARNNGSSQARPRGCQRLRQAARPQCVLCSARTHARAHAGARARAQREQQAHAPALRSRCDAQGRACAAAASRRSANRPGRARATELLADNCLVPFFLLPSRETGPRAARTTPRQRPSLLRASSRSAVVLVSSPRAALGRPRRSLRCACRNMGRRRVALLLFLRGSRCTA